MCNEGLNEVFGEKLLNFMLVQLPIFGTLSPHPPAFTCTCGNALHYACDGVCGSREACMCNKGLNEAFGEKLFNFMLLNSGYFVLFYHPP